MPILLAIFAAPLAVGLALLVVGLRGRRTDDHPVCRRCGYDLTGTATAPTSPADRCPECGADLSRRRAVRAGHRIRRRLSLAAAGLLLAPTLATVGVGCWAHARGVDPTSYKPAWWLRVDLDRGPTLRAQSLAELTARVSAGRLPQGQADAVSDRALAAQASSDPWDPAWGRYLEAARAAHRLNQDRWARYGRQALVLRFVVGPAPSYFRQPGRYAGAKRVLEGESCVLTVVADPPRLVSAQFSAWVRVGSVSVDPRVEADGQQPHVQRPAPFTPHSVAVWVGGGSPAQATDNHMIVRGEVSRDLPAGEHRLTGTATVRMYDGHQPLSVLTADAGLPPRERPDVALPTVLSGSLPVGHRPPRVVIPGDREVMRQAMGHVRLERGPGTAVALHVDGDALPHRAAFAVRVRPIDGYGRPDREWSQPLTGSVICPAGVARAFDLNDQWLDMLAALDVTRADVMLEPRPDLLRDDGDDTTPVWGEPIIISDVELTTSPAARPSPDAIEGMRSAVRTSVRDLSVVEDTRRRTVVTGRIVKPPRDIMARMFLRLHNAAGDATVLLGPVTCAAGGTSPFVFNVQIDNDSATTAAAVFDLDPNWTPSYVDRSPIRGEPCVIDNIAIRFVP